jgi:putative transposase
VEFGAFYRKAFIGFMQYRRARSPGATYFFTIVTFQRQLIFHDAIAVNVLRSAFRDVMERMPFQIDAIVVLPEHIRHAGG